MAKNLKFNIKNAQLAEALKLNQLKKPASSKAKKTETQSVDQPDVEKSPAPIAAAPSVTPEPIAPVEPVAPAPEPTPEPAAPRVEETRSPPSTFRPRPPADGSSYPPRRNDGPYERRPYQQNTSSGGYSRPQTDRPAYQGQSDRPGYQGQSDRPGYQGRSPGNYTPRPAGSNYPPRTPGSYTPRPPGSGGYTPRPAGAGGYTPRPQSGNGYPSSSPRPPFRREGMAPPDTKKAFPTTKDHPTREAPPVKKTTSAEDDKFRKAPPAATKAVKKPDAYRSFDARDRHGLRAGDEEVWRKKKAFKFKSQMPEEVIRPKSLKVRLPISVKDLASEMKLKASQLISKLFMQGVAITLNDYLDDETTIQLLGHEFECDITIDTSEEKRIKVTDRTIRDEIKESSEDQLHLRPPVVTFMGHVDHGKTSLIDAIRKTNRVAGEAGAITQHIGAFKCQTAVGNLTILDTPGHEAFSAMRSRGADVTDIVVLVVAGDEGIRAQTIEALTQALQAKVPIVVAINKSDKPNFNPETVYRQLADQNLLPEAWGGTTITVNCSAVTSDGVKELLEMLALQAEVLELRANPGSRARGTVIESEMHKGMGAVATILVQNGTLRIGDSIVFGQNYARIKTMHDEFGKEIEAASPSTPVKITGLSGLPIAGSEFVAVKDEKEARDISQKRTEGHKNTLLQQSKRGSLENFLQQKAESGEKKILNLIVKADVQGSLEALKTSLLKIPSKKVEIAFISEGVGEVSESDIQYAATSKATIIGFHTKIESHAESLIKQLKVNVRLHDIIYHAVDDTKELMLALLDKIAQENEIGQASVKAVFKSSHLGNIAGCQVTDGIIKRNCAVRLMRGKELVWKGPLASLKRVKEDVKEVSKGIECGIVLQNFDDVKEGDVIHAIEITYLEQELS